MSFTDRLKINEQSRKVENKNVKAFLQALIEPEQTFEIRLFKCPDRLGGKYLSTHSGFFDDFDVAARDIARYEQIQPPGIYVTLNPVSHDLMALAENKIVAKAQTTTSDSDVLRRRWLFLDLDPKRKTGISATDAELESATVVARKVMKHLTELGWPEPIQCMSGNGRYLLYRIDLTNNDDSLQLVKSVLTAIGSKFSDSKVDIDSTASNASRIIKIAGTVARKGEDFKGSDKAKPRPHRTSWFTLPEGDIEVVDENKLRALVVQSQRSEPKKQSIPKSTFDMQTWIDEYRVPVNEPKDWNGGHRWVFKEPSPLCQCGDAKAAVITVSGEGVCGAMCQHDHCTWNWRDLRAHYEPESKQRRPNTPEEDFGKVDPDADQKTETTSDGSELQELLGPEWIMDLLLSTEAGFAAGIEPCIEKEFRYVPDWGRWLFWDGKRFKQDVGKSRINRKIRDLTQQCWSSLDEVVSGSGDVKVAFGACKRFSSAKFQREIETLLRCQRTLAISHEQLNQQPYLFNTKNGTVDMRSGKFKSADQDDLLTQMANVKFDKNADCPEWKQTLNLIFNGDDDMVRFVQQLLGYSMTGDLGEHILPVACGNGRNGKSTITDTILAIFGEYGMMAPETLILGTKEQHPTEKVQLFGKRLVAISEPPTAAKLKEARIKELTGDNMVTARRMREDFWTFKRTHTFWLSTNSPPVIEGQDRGIWRRILMIPFDVDLADVVTEVRKDMTGWLVENEAAGILNWMIAGYQDYLAGGGFAIPETVHRSTAEYQVSEDPLESFVSDCCDIGEDETCRSASLYEAYKLYGGWWSMTRFGREMSARFRKYRARTTDSPTNPVSHYAGICPNWERIHALKAEAKEANKF